MHEVQLMTGVTDYVIWRWSADHKYSAASAYGAMFIGSTSPFGANLIWGTRAPPKVRFFWLAMHRRCWTANRRMRHGLQDRDDCIMCLQASETLDHILLGCVLSRQVWIILLSKLGLTAVATHGGVDTFRWWAWARRRVHRSSRKGFDSLIMLTCWVLWKERNAWTFMNEAKDARELCLEIRQEADLWLRAGYSTLSSLTSFM